VRDKWFSMEEVLIVAVSLFSVILLCINSSFQTHWAVLVVLAWDLGVCSSLGSHVRVPPMSV